MMKVKKFNCVSNFQSKHYQFEEKECLAGEDYHKESDIYTLRSFYPEM